MLDRSSQFLRTHALPGPQSKVLFTERRLRDAILWCEVAPGELVSEAALGARFNLARAATRAALAKLAGEGLVQPVARKGWRVRAITGALIGDLVAARRLAEPVLAEATLGAAELRHLDDLVSMIHALRRQTDPQSLLTARQHERALVAIVAGHANVFLQRWLHELWDHSDRVVRFFEGRGAAGLPVPDPAPLAAALASGDRDGVRAQRLAAVDAFELFVARGLLSDPAEIGSSGLGAVRKHRNGEKEPRSADGSAHTFSRSRGAYS